jgi:dodecin
VTHVTHVTTPPGKPFAHLWAAACGGGREPCRRREEPAMSDHVYKLVELVGSSTTGTDDAIRNAVATAAATLRQVDWFEVVQMRGHIADGKVAHFQVTLKVGFRLEK